MHSWKNVHKTASPCKPDQNTDREQHLEAPSAPCTHYSYPPPRPTTILISNSKISFPVFMSCTHFCVSVGVRLASFIQHHAILLLPSY